MMSAEYLAGFFDGEGAIMISRGSARRNWTSATGEAKPTMWVLCTVANTDVSVLREIQMAYGGRLRARRLNQRPNWKQVHILEWSCRQPEALLTAMLPHLRVKRERALLALEFLRLTPRRSTTKKLAYVRNTPEQMEARANSFRRREEIAERIKQLNQRGVESVSCDSVTSSGNPNVGR